MVRGVLREFNADEADYQAEMSPCEGRVHC